MNRHLQIRPTVPDALEVWAARPQNPRCLAPDAPTECSGAVVNSHVIQRRGGGLQNIAQAGKVYGFKRHPTFFLKKDGFHEPSLVGITAEVGLPLFCGQHDRALFLEAETQWFKPTAMQLLEFNYRTVVARLYANEAVIPQLAHLYDADRGVTRDDQRRIFILVDELHDRSRLYLARSRALKAQYDQWITGGSSPQVNALVVWFDGASEFMCASLTYALMDFQGRPITQDESELAHLCFYTVANEAGVAAVFSWVGRNVAAERLCSSLLLLPPEDRAFAVLRYALEYIDLIYFAPDWWGRLSATDRRPLVELLTEHSKPLRVHRTDALVSSRTNISSLRYRTHEFVGEWRSE